MPLTFFPAWLTYRRFIKGVFVVTYVRREYPEWSWSFSRSQVFESCKRRYYYQYYGSHNGWEDSASQEQKTAYRLKKLANLFTVLGEAVHTVAEQAAAKAAAGQQLPQPESVEESIRAALRTAYKDSRDRRPDFLRRPNRVLMLHEFYYGGGPDARLVETIKERAKRCAEHLLGCQTMVELQGSSPELLQCENFDTFPMNGTPVFAVPDLMYRVESGRMVLVDWKTGAQEEEHRQQLAFYAMYLVEKHRTSPERILGRLEYLNGGSHEDVRFDRAALDRAEERALASMGEMRQYLADVKLNQPLAKKRYPLTDNRHQCPSCSFFELCQDELERGADVDG